MADLFRLSVVLLLFGLTGCATTQFQFTSVPSGANVSLRKTHFGYPFWGQEQWILQGTTPCKVTYPNHGPPMVVLVSFSTNYSRIIELEKRTRSVNAIVGPQLAAYGFPAGLFAGLMGGSALGGAAAGVGLAGFGVLLCDRAYYFPRTDVRVEFNSLDAIPAPVDEKKLANLSAT